MKGLVFALWLCAQFTAPQKGTLVYDTVYSPAIEGNMLGDSAYRNIVVYLPRGYDDSLKHYPVVYLLHGWGDDHTFWAGKDFHIRGVINDLIHQSRIGEMIVVAPDSLNKYGGGWYANSPVTGNWEDFIVYDLVLHMDANYRTLPQRSSRGIFGYSAGASGALKLAFKHPEIYAATFALSGGGPLEMAPWVMSQGGWREALSLTSMAEFHAASVPARAQISAGAAFSPNPGNPPFFVDLPFGLVNGELVRNDTIWQAWLDAEDIPTIAYDFRHNLSEVVVSFRRGSFDHPDHGGVVSDALSALGVPHTFKVFEGGHVDPSFVPQFEDEMMPFFSTNLAFEMDLLTNVGARGKLPTTWGEMKRQ